MNNNADEDDEAGDKNTASASPEISPTLAMRPVPPIHQNISVNGCKTPGCENFGVAPMEWPMGGRGRGNSNPSPDRYRIVNTGLSKLVCGKCGKYSTLKNNKGIYEERQRLSQGVLDPPPSLACPHCAATMLRKFGTTHSGSARYQCGACRKTFAVGKSTRYQKKPHKNEMIFSLIVNKVPLSRMCEIADLNIKALYDKIDFIYGQCRKFSADRERKLAGMTFGSRYLCTDRQDYIVNWGDRSAKKTVQLTAIATADQESGYVFGMIPNFDKTAISDEAGRLFQ